MSYVSDLRFIMEGGTTSEQTNIISPGALQWNNISSGVSLSNNSSNSKCTIAWTTFTDPDYSGHTMVYNYYGQEIDDYTSTWYSTRCEIYYNNISGYTNSEKKAVVTHEVGHALGLNEATDMSAKPVMRQGIDKALSPNQVDKAHLKLKWGN